MKIKENYRLILALSLVVLVGLIALQGYAGAGQIEAPRLRPFLPDSLGEAVEKFAQTGDPLSPLEGERVWPTDPAQFKLPPHTEAPDGPTCQQLIVNPQLDVLVFDDGTGTAEPWVILWPIVYYDDTIFSSPSYSLVQIIGDANDPTPTYDGFGQAVNMPAGLTSVTVQYDRRIDFANGVDRLFGELWTLDANGFLETFITGWELSDTPVTWTTKMFTMNDAPTLAQMSGQSMALVLDNFTTDTSPGEVAFFDDITLTACFNPPDYAIFMPVIEYNAGTGPICSPPSESPPDSWHANRGLIQTGAVCNTTLSQLDDRDYYSFVAAQTGTHTVRLSNLPNGSNWAALVYNDTVVPPTAPTNGGTCYTSAPGSANKTVVCTFTAGQKYVVKVSSGSTPLTGSYTLQVTKP